jgi:ribulose-phosphate 3-epimerase
VNAHTVRIAPSILTADFGKLAEQVRAAEDGGADLFHLDIMDGHFVPQLSFGPEVVAAVRSATTLPIEAHMMVARPEEHFESLARAGAQTLVFHVESEGDVLARIAAVRALGCRAGVAINPNTPVERAQAILQLIDEVIVMLVHPGRGGQEMLVEHLEKVRRLRAAAGFLGRDVTLEVDGGVKAHNIAQCAVAGVDQVVAGSAVYNDRETPAEALAALRRALAG